MQEDRVCAPHEAKERSIRRCSQSRPPAASQDQEPSFETPHPGARAALQSSVTWIAGLSLSHALELLILIAEKDPGRYPRASIRWLERLLGERELEFGEVQLAAGTLAALPGRSRLRPRRCSGNS